MPGIILLGQCADDFAAVSPIDDGHGDDETAGVLFRQGAEYGDCEGAPQGEGPESRWGMAGGRFTRRKYPAFSES